MQPLMSADSITDPTGTELFQAFKLFSATECYVGVCLSVEAKAERVRARRISHRKTENTQDQ